MSIWDNIKGRFGKKQPDYDEYDDYYDDDYYDDGYGDDGYHNSPSERSGANSPLVSMTDIRSQPINDRGAGSREDRIPMPVVRERRSSTAVTGLAETDSEAFRDSLARSSENSLVQLHSGRMQMEANAVPEFNVSDIAGQRATSAYLSTSASTVQQAGVSRYSTPLARSNAGAPIPRGPRQLEHVKPASYADAENISISLRRGAAVVLDLTDVRPELAKRILDFSFGVTSAFEGQVDRYADRVYVLTRNGALTEAERAMISL